MTAALIGLAALAIVGALLLSRSNAADAATTARAVRHEAALERTRHMDAMKDLVVAQMEERQEWARERAVLLNRIQDPPAGVASSLAAMRPAEPEPSPLDVEFVR